MTLLRLLAYIALLMASTTAFARPYGFVSLLSKSDYDVDVTAPFSGSANSALFIGIGYRVARHFAGEFAYFDPGVIHTSSSRAQGATTFSTLRSYDADAFNVAAVGILPASDWFSFLLRAGAYRIDRRLTTSTSETTGGITTATSNIAESRAFWAPSIGIGFQLGRAEGLQMRLLLEQLKSNELSLRLFTLQAGYAF